MRAAADRLAATMKRRIKESGTHVRVLGPPGSPVTDIVTGNVTRPAQPVLYDGPATIAERRHQVTVVQRGDQQEQWADYQVAFPLDAPPFPNKAEVHVTASGDPSLVGALLVIDEDVSAALAVRRRYYAKRPKVVPA